MASRLPIEPDAEVFRLRSALSDLVAMSTMPAAWAGREPSDIAAGLADVLIGSLRLDFAFVRLCDPTRSAAVEVTRGHAWETFPEWLQRHLASVRWLSRREVIADVGGGCRGLVVPIGVNAEGGVVAAACVRSDFPGEIDLLLLSVAANHAATAFQSALAEQDLRQVRSELEMKVSERTSELRRATAELQTILDASPVGIALFDKDRAVQRCNRAFERILGWRADEIAGRPASILKTNQSQPNALTGRLDAGEAFANVETRLLRKDGSEFDAAVSCAFLEDESGNRTGFVGTVQDISERAEEERHAHLRFLESMDLINRAIQGTNDLEQMMSDVLEEVLSIFNCDRAWLIYPCDPEATSYGVPMEQTRPEFPGAFSLGHDLPMDPGTAAMFQAMRACSGPLQFGPGSEQRMPEEVANRFGIKSQISMVVYPKGDKPYLFGLHQCSSPRLWTPQEERLFQEIGRRLADALTSLSMFRNLRDSEARLEEAQRIAHVGYWERDLESNRITWSDETYRIFGLAPEEGAVDFAAFQERIHPEDRQMMLAATAEAERGGPRYDVEYRVARRTGEVRIVHSQGDVTTDESGRPQRIFGTVQDVTERKRAEAEVRESERRYRSIFQSTRVSIWEEDFSRVKDAIDDLKTRGVRDFRQYCAAHPEFVEQAIAMVKIADVNDATVQLFAAQSKDELLDSLHKVFSPETVQVFVGELVAIAEGRTSYEAETALQTLKGERLTVLFTMTFPPGRLDNVLVTLMDITQRKRAEYLTEQVFESSPDRVSIVGRDYRYRRVNPVFERNWNMRAERVVGLHVADLLGAEVFEEKVKPNLDRCFAGEDVSRTEWFPDAQGRRYLSLTYSPLRPDSDQVEAALVIVRDLTELMLALEGLRQAHSDLAHISRVTTMGELTASLAHEINQPIAAAVTNANACLRWLSRAEPDIDEARLAASRIVKDGTRAGDIISRIRLLFKKGAPQRESVDVNEVIQEMIGLLRSEAARHSIPIRAELAAGLPRVKADRVQLQQVFMNLMLNGIDAIKDTRVSGELTIRSEQGANHDLLISVSDTGVGLPRQQAAQIFDAFFTTKPDGTGMGLPISRTIIESHGGQLWAAANSGRGATFRFTLPGEAESPR